MKKLAALFTLLLISCNEYEVNEIENSSQEKSLQSRLAAQDNNFFPIEFNSNIVFGMTGHPFTQAPYADSTAYIPDQIQKLKEHGCNYYRFEINENTDMTPASFAPFISNQINILPVLIINPDANPSASLSDLYQQGIALGNIFYSKLGSLAYYEVGNELSIRCLKTLAEQQGAPFYQGNDINDYSTLRINQCAQMMKGVIFALKQNNPTCKIVTSNGGYLQNAFFQLLINQRVTIDVVGVHWYSNMGLMNSPINGVNSLNRLESYGKPIWITEFGFYEQTLNVNNPPIEKAQYLIDFVNDLKNHDLVQGLFFYQLYFQSLEGFDNVVGQIMNFSYQQVPISSLTTNELNTIRLWHQNERNYGIFNLATGQYNLQSDAYKYKIEEIKYGFDDYVYELYNRLLVYNAATDNQSIGIPFHVNALKTSHDKDPTINAFFTSERYYEKFIKSQYLELLDTPNPPMDNTGVGYWKTQMMSPNNMTRENVIVNFCNEPQFWQQSGSNRDGFIDRLYLKLLGRPSDTEGKNYWINRYNSLPTSSRKVTIINEFIITEEYLKRFVKRQYLDLLSRPNPDTAGVNAWTTQMLAPLPNRLSQVNLMKNFVKSEGFLERSIYEGYIRRNSPFNYNFGEDIFYLY